MIKFYRLAISPLLGQNCRFYPSCSAYAMEAFTQKGFIKGIFYTAWRLLRCHPFSAGGYDPLPGTANILKDEK